MQAQTEHALYWAFATLRRRRKPVY